MTALTTLSVVMPVYNEGATVEHVVAEWIDTFERLEIAYEFLILDDGSRDETRATLGSIAAEHESVRVLRHDNIGHGPTILRGYRESRGEWVLQIDSDGEIGPAAFEGLWRLRDGYDFLLGRRISRTAPLVRRVITAVSRASVYVLFGTGIRDVNVPYRLMRGSILKALVTQLPRDLFAPNVILSGLAVREKLRIHSVPVEHVGRQQGQSSLGRFNILAPAARSLWQTAVVAWRVRVSNPVGPRGNEKSR